MSHTNKILRTIATGEEYKSLCAAIDNRDYQTLYTAFTRLSHMLKEAGKEVEDKIDNLPRQNKDEDRRKFQKAFEMRSQAAVPQWHWINSQIQKQNIIDGIVVSIGKMGDPITRTPAGKLVVLSGSKAKEGDKVTFTVVSEGPKIDFGRQFELTPDNFYFLLNQEVHQKVNDSLDAVQKELESFPGTSDAENLSRMDKMLKMLEEVRELSPKMLDIEREKVLKRVMIYRRRLLGSIVEKLALDLISDEEEKAIRELCGGDEAKIAVVLTAPGLFNPKSFSVFKEGLFNGDKIRGYEEILAENENKIDTMDSALKFEEFKAAIDELQPKAQLYVDKMEQLFQRLRFKAKQLSNTIVDDKTGSTEAVLGKIGEAFSEKELGNELQYVFRSAKVYLDARGATMNLKAKLGDTKYAVAESILKPYLRQKVDRAFS
jgi:hypothetical protein